MKTLMSLNENTVPVNLTPEYLKERIPFLKSFNDFSNENRINMQKIVYNQNVNMKLGDNILEFEQFNTSLEFYYSIYEMNPERYRISFTLKNRFWAMPPNDNRQEDQLQHIVLLMALEQMEKKLSYTYDEIKPNPTLSPEELNQVINNLNKCFFEFEDYVMNQMNVDVKNPLDETN
jgi:hypothetical protein